MSDVELDDTEDFSLNKYEHVAEVEITATSPSSADKSIKLNGIQIPCVKRAWLQIDAVGYPVLRLDINVTALTIGGVFLTDGVRSTREALIELGWTPPPDA